MLNPLKRKEVNLEEYTALIKIRLRGNVRFHAVVELRRIFSTYLLVEKVAWLFILAVAGLKCGLFVSKADEDVGVIMRPARRTRYAVERNK